jgi:hypothetical protein
MEKTPFRTVYTKKSNFVTQSFFTDAIPIDYGGTGNFVIPRHGDFVTRMYLLIDYPSSTSTTVNQAHAMIDYIEFIVGGKIIQRETGETLNMRVNLTETDNDTFSPNQLYRMLGGGPQYPFTDTVQYPRPYRLHVPLPMWFAGDPSQAFPLAALRYQELEVNIGFRTANRWGGVDTGVSGSNVCLHIEYGYMDNEVLETFIKQPLLYPVEQFQVLEPPAYTGDSVIYIPSQDYTTSEGTSFINPVKALFVLYKDLATETTNIFDYSRGKTFVQLTSPDDNDFLNSMEVILDGQVMLPEEAGTFELLRGYEYYAHFPGCTQRIFFGTNQRYYSYIYALSFCQDPMNKKDPNGSINFSVVKNPSIKLDSKGNNGDKIRVRVYALSVNFLYIENGVARLLFDASENNFPKFP